MANQLNTITMYTKEALMVLKNSLTFTANVNRSYDSNFAKSGAKIGNTLNVRKPVRFIGTTGRNLNVEDIIEESVPITLDTQFHVDFEFPSDELALSIDQISDRYIKPAIETIANKIDYDGLALSNLIANTEGSVTGPADNQFIYLKANALLDSEGAGKGGDRTVVVDPMTQACLVNSLKNQFNPSNEIGNQFTTGNMGKMANLRFNMDQNVQTHTCGTGVDDAITVNGANQGGGTILVNGLVGTLNPGDVFTIANVYAINPQSRQSTGRLRQFTVRSVIGGNRIAFSPNLVPVAEGEAYSNVTTLPANGAAITFIGDAGATVQVGVAYHKDAFALACADLPMPKTDAVEAAVVSDDSLGLSIRMIKTYDVKTDTFICRLDILYGWAVLYPELAVKIFSNVTTVS